MSKSIATLLAVCLVACASDRALAATVTEVFTDEAATQWSAVGLSNTVSLNATTGTTITFDVTVTSSQGNMGNSGGFLANAGVEGAWFHGPLGMTFDDFVVSGLGAGEQVVANSIKVRLEGARIESFGPWVAANTQYDFTSTGTALSNIEGQVPSGDNQITDITLDAGLTALAGGNGGSYTATLDAGLNGFLVGELRYGNFDFTVEYATEPTPTAPEPSAALLAGLALVGLVMRRRRRARS